MERYQKVTEEVENYCKKIGVDVVGFADAKHFDRFDEENKPQSYLINAKTVIILGFHLYDLTLDAWNYFKEENRSYQFADSLIENFCYKLKEKLRMMDFKAVVVPYRPGLFLKDSAALAGIGPIGKSNLLLTPSYGSQIRLRAVVTDAPLICGEPILESKYCKDCDICIKACPANAFIDGKYTKAICNEWAITNWKILSNHTVIWCNTCIEECPVTQRSKA